MRILYGVACVVCVLALIGSRVGVNVQPVQAFLFAAAVYCLGSTGIIS